MRSSNSCAIVLATAGVMIAPASALVKDQPAADARGPQLSPDVTKQALIGQDASRLGGIAGPPTCFGDPTNLLYPLDGTYVLVDFFGDGPTGSGPAQGPDQHNDDDSATVLLPFSFDLYGDLDTQCFVNNNGNLSFGQPFSTFTATGFPASGFAMIAPFWGDVDTGNPNNFVGDVWMKFVDSGPPAGDDTLVVTWDNVGY